MPSDLNREGVPRPGDLGRFVLTLALLAIWWEVSTKHCQQESIDGNIPQELRPSAISDGGA